MGHPQILTSDALHERFGNFRWKADGKCTIEIRQGYDVIWIASKRQIVATQL